MRSINSQVDPVGFHYFGSANPAASELDHEFQSYRSYNMYKIGPIDSRHHLSYHWRLAFIVVQREADDVLIRVPASQQKLTNNRGGGNVINKRWGRERGKKGRSSAIAHVSILKRFRRFSNDPKKCCLVFSRRQRISPFSFMTVKVFVSSRGCRTVKEGKPSTRCSKSDRS